MRYNVDKLWDTTRNDFPHCGIQHGKNYPCCGIQHGILLGVAFRTGIIFIIVNYCYRGTPLFRCWIQHGIIVPDVGVWNTAGKNLQWCGIHRRRIFSVGYSREESSAVWDTPILPGIITRAKNRKLLQRRIICFLFLFQSFSFFL